MHQNLLSFIVVYTHHFLVVINSKYNKYRCANNLTYIQIQQTISQHDILFWVMKLSMERDVLC